MWVYQQFEPGCYTVGFYTPVGAWVAESDHKTHEKAADRVHYLNGGSMPDDHEPSLKAMQTAMRKAGLQP